MGYPLRHFFLLPALDDVLESGLWVALSLDDISSFVACAGHFNDRRPYIDS
ncbi:Hypothetical protein FKW44_000497 [Caligus rogercresseyi]|uniref:Uncharacterized protein n=1 Tax=Caligus rogercresseyi TaxID=217165 RepID=A0A7T8QUW6_CALRO|nr:Hypothetical protein FKW44_000497 [Caligus rogercresseyi]